MTAFHGFIGINNPNGMPVEWNILMIYGGYFLFGFHPEARLSALTDDAGPARRAPLLARRDPGRGQLLPVAGLVPAVDALLRRQLGLQHLAHPQRRRPASSTS